MCYFAEAEIDRKLRAEVLQHAQQVNALTCHTGEEIKSPRGTRNQRHRQSRAGHCQLHADVT